MPRSAAETRQRPSYYRALDDLSSARSNELLPKSLMTSVRLLAREFGSFRLGGHIYLVHENDLVLGAYAGDEETEHVKILIGQGICGSAAKEGVTIVVPDVSKDPR